MKKLLIKFQKIKKAISNLYNIENKIKLNTIIEEYEKDILKNKHKGILEYEEGKGNQIIVSLTTYTKRIYDVHLVIESLFRQTIKPNKIILWLSEDEFKGKGIPLILKKQVKKGLEIGYCKDIKSYKKLLPSLKKFSNDLIITADDDILYPYDFIENLYKSYQENPKSVICYRGSNYKILKNGKLAPYETWESIETNESNKIFLTTGGGVLFFPKCFDEEVFNIKKILELCPTADDIWVNAMLLKNGTQIRKVRDPRRWNKRFFILEENQDIGLFQKNNFEKQNDIQINKVFEYYSLWKNILIEIDKEMK